MSTVLRASPPPQAARPIPRGRPVEGHAPSPLGVSRVALDLRVPTCRRHYPGGPLGSDRSWGGLFQPFPIHPQRRRPSPSDCKVGVHIGRFEACSTFTCVTACRLAASPKRHICLEGSDGFVTSTAAPIATGWSDPVAGWELHPLKSKHLFTAHNRSDPEARRKDGLARRDGQHRGETSNPCHQVKKTIIVILWKFTVGSPKRVRERPRIRPRPRVYQVDSREDPPRARHL